MLTRIGVRSNRQRVPHIHLVDNCCSYKEDLPHVISQTDPTLLG